MVGIQNDNWVREYFNCICMGYAHALVVEFDQAEPSEWCSLQFVLELSGKEQGWGGFLFRCGAAVRYVLGLQRPSDSRVGVELNEGEARRLLRLIERYLDSVEGEKRAIAARGQPDE